MPMIRVGWLAVVVLLLSGTVRAAGEYPEPIEKYVNDFADVITESDASRIRNALSAVDEQTGIEITVVTIPDLAAVNSRDSLRHYAAGLFDHWGVGDARRNNGIMILFSLGDREVWI
ncbi:MAG: TPM domain-containing protein, partial [Planctomycetes bacterium]|nr:TPM domain-containing protein [Planctomycetota bacterium]